ncbi:serine/threonine-protein kinase [Goodfellowiella coeruleoviolacea]
MSAIERDQLIAKHYRLLERIGSGAMGVVWQARDERLHRVVAIKQLLLRPDLDGAMTETARRRAMREARIAARLQHPNAVAVFDVAEHNGDPCLVLEYVAARGLDRIIAERGSLPPQEVAAIGGQVASALAAAHAVGIVHRDVKPGNILVDEAGIAKITDFGISRAVGDGTVTDTGRLAGTPAYLSPEVARGQDTTPAADVFSLGATLYHAVEGEPPFGLKHNPLALLHAAAAGKVKPPKKAGPLTDLLMSLLQSDPEERPTMEQATVGLTALAAGKLAPIAASLTPARGIPVIRDDEDDTAADGDTPVVVPPTPTSVDLSPPPTDPPAEQREVVRTSKFKRPFVVVVVVVLVAAVVTVVVVFQYLNSTTDNSANGLPTSGAVTTVTETQKVEVTASNPPPQSPQSHPGGEGSPSEPVTDFRTAGQLVVDYYNNPTGSWGLLSPKAQESFGGVAGFQQYWSAFRNSWPKSANASHNADGSATVSVGVTRVPKDGAQQQEQRVNIRVINQGGTYLIDQVAM